MSHNEILIADAHVEQLQVLLSGLRPGVHVQLVSSQDDAMDMLAQALADPELDTLHVLGHGAPGEVILGGQKIDTAAMPELKSRLHKQADSTNPDTQICLWSCRTGADLTGDIFMNAFAQTTNATVFASENLVGHTHKGGTWTLEKSAAPRMGVPFSADALQGFEGVLGTPTLQSYTDTGVSSTDKISTDVNFVLSSGSGSSGNSKNLYERISTDGGVTYGDWAVKSTAQNQFTVSNATNGVHQYVWQNTLPSAGTVEGSLTLVVDTVAMTATAVDSVIGVTNTTDVFSITLSEAPSRNLTAADFVTTNSSISALVKVDATHYNLSLTPASSVASGSMTLGIKSGITDIAGNATVAATIATQAIDTLAPSAPASLDLAAADDTGVSITDNITNQTTGLTITGNAEANATVELFNGSVSLGRIMADPSGVFTTDISLSGSSTGYNITAKATDAAGNASGASLPLTITVDAVAPAGPAINTVAGNDVINIVERDATGGVVISGTTEAGATVMVNGQAATVSGTTWTTSLTASQVDALGQGSETLTVVATDAAGNTSTQTKSISVDTVTPGTPAVTDTSTLTNGFAASTTQAISVAAEAGSTVVVKNAAGATIATGTADATGQFTANVTGLGQGVNTLSATATDTAGNVSSAGTVSIKVDSLAPNAPTNLDLAAADDTGFSSTDNITNQTTGLTISGTAEANATVELFNGGVSLGKITANSSGVFTTDLSLSGSSTGYNITAKATDAAGNASGASLPLTITVDTVAPNAATISTVGGADVFANAVQVTLSGASSDVNATVVKVSDGVTGHAAVNATYNATTGAWSADITGLNRGALTVTADVADAAGNHALAAKTVYSSIGSAVAAATAGSTVTIAQGTYQDSAFAASSVTGTTTVREIMISKGISIVGLGDGNSANGQEVIINSAAASRAFVVSGDVTSGAVSISGIKVVGGKEAVSVDGADHVTGLGSLSVTNSTFVGQSTTGLMVELEKQGSDLKSLVVQGVVFDQSASAGKSININNNGTNYYEGIRTFGFDGNAVIKDVTVMGASGGVTTNASQYGIHLHGASSNNMGATGIYGSGPTMGDVTLDNVVVTGGFAKNAVAIYEYANIDGLHGAQGALNISGAKAGWVTVLNVDGIEANYDASKWGVVLGNNMASLQGEDYSGATLLQPGNVGSQIVGTAGTDIFNGKAGNDVLDGGSGVDIAQVGATSASDVSFGRAAGTNALTVSTSYTATDTLSNIEYVTATNPLTGATIKTFVIVDAFADTATAIAAAPAGSQLVKAGLLDLNLTDVSAAQAKGLTFYGADNVTVHASAADLLAKGPALVSLQGMGVDSFITTDVVSKAQYDTLVSNAGSANSIVTPSVTITDNQPAVANVAGGDVTYKFTFDQAVTNFSASDVDVANGTKGALVASTVAGEEGRVFTLTVTPQTGFEGSMSLTVGNASSSQVVDTSAPAAPVVTDDSALTNGYATSTTQTISVAAEAGSAVVVTNATGATVASGVADATGHFTANVTGLSLGDNSLTATATDKAGNTSDVSASLNIHVNNDPVVTGALSQTAAEGADAFTTSLLANATDADGNNLTVTNVSYTVDGVAVTGTPAGVSISGNSISVNPQDPSFDPLPQGAQRSITVNYSVDDGHGGVVASSETISITGTNDAPVIELGGHTFIENTVVTGSLAESVTDVDTGDTHTFSFVGAPIEGFTLNSDGSFSIDTSSYDRLAEGEKLDIPVTVGVDDGNGGYVTKTVVVTVEGTNDVATVSSATASVSEGNQASDLSTSGQLVITDADGGQAAVAAQDVAGAYGNFHVNTDGSWTYTGNGAHDELSVGQKVSDSIIVTSVDGTATGTIAVNITGSNDLATVSAVGSSGTHTPDGTVAWTQVLSDPGQQNIYVQGLADAGNGSVYAGGYSNDSNGNQNGFITKVDAGGQQVWTQHVGAGGQYTIGMDVAAGGNGTVVEAGYTNGNNGYLHTFVSAVDSNGNALWTTQTNTNSFYEIATGVAVAADGSVYAGGYSYNSNWNGQDGFITKLDAGGHELWTQVVDVGGQNDVALDIAVGSNGTVVEVGYTSASNNWAPHTFVSALDSNGNALWTTQTNTNSFYQIAQSVAVAADGSVYVGGYTYDSNWNGADGFITKLDSGGHELWTQRVDAGGQYDIAMDIAVGSDGSVYESGYSQIQTSNGAWNLHSFVAKFDSNGQALSTFVGNEFYAVPQALVVSSDGSVFVGGYSYDSNWNAQSAFVTKLGGTSTGTANELTESNDSASLNTSGQLVVADADAGEAHTVAQTVVGTYGSFAVDSNGAWTYTASSAHDELTAGQQVSDSFTVTSLDGTGTSQVVIHITGSNDAATVSSNATELSESNDASALNASGTLVIADADAGQAVVVAKDVAGTYGTFHVNADGSWTYTGNGAHDELTAGQKVSDSITVTSVDGTATGNITVNITGTNDLATVSSDTSAVTEGNTAAALNARGKLVIAEADAGEALVVAKDVAGTYGTFHVNADGSWTYTGNGAHDELTAGQKVSDSITVTSADGTATGNITVNITGSNDVPTVSTSTTAVSEGNDSSALNASGQLVIADADAGEALVVASDVKGTYGTFHVNADGSWTYTGNGAHDELAEGQKVSDSIVVKSLDGTGSGTITVNITGTNDAPVITTTALTDVTGNLLEADASVLRDTGTLTFADVDLLDVHSTSVQANAGNVLGGKLVMGAVSEPEPQRAISLGFTSDPYPDGVSFSAAGVSVTLTAGSKGDDVAAQFGKAMAANPLYAGYEIQVDRNTVFLIAPEGKTVPNIPFAEQLGGVNIDLAPNDPGGWKNAIWSGNQYQVELSGTTIHLTSADGSLDLTFPGRDPYQPVDTVLNTAEGSVGWTYEIDSSKVQHLAAGQTVNESFTVQVSDNHGGTVSQVVTVAVTGTNDSATVSSATTAVTESNDASSLNASGQLVIADADEGEALVVAKDVAGTYGTFHVNADGSWTYTGNGAHDELTAGQKVSDSITVSSVDGTATGNITVNITGSNDIATVSSATTAVTEGNTAAALSASGKLVIADADAGEALVVAKDVAGTYGTFHVNADGSWTYTGNGAHDELTAGQKVSDSITVKSSDGTGSGIITVNITGTNDAAVIGGVSTAVLTETNAVQSASGQLTVTDVDNALTFIAQTGVAGSSGFGNFSVNTAGKWSYTMSTAHNEFVDGHAYTDSFTVQSADGTAKVVTVTINGTDDKSVIAGVSTAGLTETNAVQTAAGQLTVTDVDGPPPGFVPQSGVKGNNNYGVFNVDASGKWGYTMSTAHDEFAAGKNYTDSITVTTRDGVSQVVTVTIAGTNDAASIGGVKAGNLTETNAIQTASGQLTVTDVDSAATFVPQTVNGLGGFGKFSIDATGKWTYTMGTAHDEFSAGKTYTDSFNATTADGTQQLVSVTILGTDDKSTIAGVSIATLTESNAAQSVTGQLLIADVDSVTTMVVQSGVNGTSGYGKFSVDATGKWTYVMNTAHDEFRAGTTYTDSFTSTTSDGISKVVTVSIVGTNDAAVIGGVSTATLTETNAVLTATGVLSAVDQDSAAGFTAQTGVAGTSGYGKFSIDAVGEWTYTMNTAHNEFKAGVAYTDSFSAKSADGTIKLVTVTINGTDDQAVIGGTSTATLSETNAIQTATGTLAATDVDSTAVFVAQTAVAGTNGYGKFTVDTAGKWTYTMNTAHDEFAAGKAYTDSITVKTADGASKVVTVTMNGTDDATVIQGVRTAALTETNAIQATAGKLIAVDIDSTTTFVAQTAAKGLYGTFNLGTDGTWNYSMGTAHNEFKAGTTYTETFTAETGTGTSQVVTVTINGSNDSAVITGTSTAALTETNLVQTATGTLAATDIDSAATFNVQTAVNGANGFGKFTIDATGKWVYTMNTAHDEFKAGVSYTDSFTATTADGTGKLVTVTIAGTDDKSVIGGVIAVPLIEANAVLTTQGTLLYVDVDGSNFSPFQSQINVLGTNGFGRFSIGTDGKWVYSSTTAHNEFKLGTSYTDSFTAKTADGLTQVVTVTITGTNDAAVIGGVNTATLTETNAIQTAAGQLTITDVDSTAAFIPQTAIAGSAGYGKFTVDATGKWSYAMNTAHDEFVGGVTYTDKLTVASADGTTQVLTVNIIGTNDAAVIGGVSTAALIEANVVLTAAGALTITDVDNPATFVAQTAVNGSNGFGKFTVDAAGKWTYTMNTAHDEFKLGVNYTDSITVSAVDGTTKVVTVTITGTNDAAVIGGVATAALTETNAVQSAAGQLTITDVDNAATFVTQAGTNGLFGKFTLDASGAWTYTMGTAHDEFKAGVPYTDTFNAVAADGTIKAVTVIITGTNDAAVIGGVSTMALRETNAIQTTGGQLTITDVDSAAAFVVQAAVAGTGGYGKFTLDATGKWSYTMNTAQDVFKEGVTYTDSFTAVSADGTKQLVSVNILGTNDAATFGGVATAALTESNLVQSATGQMTITDVDSAATFNVQSNVAGKAGYGTFSVDATGKWTYTMSTAHDEFKVGVVYNDSFDAISADGTVKTVTVTMLGTNDAAVITGINTATLTETDAVQTTGGTLLISDVDSSQTFVAQTGVAGLNGFGKFTLGADGTWTYTMNTAHDEFKDKIVYTDSFTAVSADGTTKLVTVTINGTNDAAVIGGVNTATLTETNAAQTATGQMTITDVDSAATFVAQTAVNGSNGYGKFTVDATGKWTYVMNNAHDEFKGGVNYTDSLTVVSTDGTPKTITVTMVGTNDSAIIGGVNTASLTETDAVQTTGGQLTISDVDNSPPALIAQTNVTGTNGYGSFSIDASGKWTYTMNSAHDEFAAGQTYTDSITVSSEDGTPKVLTVTMIGTNDLAVIGGNYTAALTETSAVQTASGSLSATDVDNSPVASFVAQTGVTGSSGYGTFNVDAAGKWTYAMKTGHDEFVGGTTYTDSFTVKTADGASKVVTVSMLGTDDTSTISGVYTAALTETNDALSTGGKLLSSDIDSPVAAAFVEQTGTTGTNGYGNFTVDASGKWTYAMNTAHDEFVKGETYTDSFTATTADGTSQVVTVTITGTNDAAVIGGTTVMALTENDAIQTTADAQMSISDVDNSAIFVTPTVAGTNGYGTFSVDASGNWTYAMGTAHNEFVKDVVYTDTATVKSADGTTQVLTVNITGTDDLSVISGTSAVGITENNDAQVITSSLTVTDVDNAAAFVPQTDVLGSNGYGSFTLDASGKWVYTMNEAHNEFLPGESYTDSITVTTIDGVTQVVTVSISGADAASTFHGDILKQMTEGDNAASVSGQLTTVDADSDVPAAVVAQVSTGDNGYGTFTVDETGAWTYTMNGAHNEFAAGTSYTDTTTVKNADGTTQLVTVHIAGTNDASVITGSSTGSITETNAVQSVSGQLVSTDVDSNSLFTVQNGVTGSNGYGAFSIDAAGNWTYTMNSAYDEFAAGQVYSDSTTVTSIDGTQQVITVNITGSNEAAVITPTVSHLVETDATITASGQIEVSDLDNAALMQAETLSGTYGNLTVAEDGSWTYVTNTANNQFVANQTYVDSFTVTSIDGTTGSFQVNILGTNDAAVISGTTKLSLTETNAVQSASAQAIATDADGGSGFVARTGLDGDRGYGTFSIDANGKWTYEMNTAHNEFVAGQVYTDNVTISTASGTSLTLMVEITGTNDAAVITANEVVKFEKDTAADLTASGTLELYDFDNSAQFVGGSFTGDYGTLNLASTGVWTYTADTAHNEFMTNALYTDTFTVAAVDGTISTVKVNMIGTADTGDVYSVENSVSIPTSFADNSLTTLTTAGVQQVIGSFDDIGLLVNAREDVVKLDFNLANADFKTSADGHHVEVTFNHDVSTLKLLSNVEAVQFNDALVRIIGADGYKDVAEATNAANKSHVNASDAVFVSVASGYDALLTHPSVADLNNTYNTLTDSYNHHG